MLKFRLPRSNWYRVCRIYRILSVYDVACGRYWSSSASWAIARRPLLVLRRRSSQAQPAKDFLYRGEGHIEEKRRLTGTSLQEGMNG